MLYHNFVTKEDLLSSVADLVQTKHEDHVAQVDTCTAVDVTAVTNLGDVEAKAANLTHPALLAHHHHHQHVPHSLVGVADIPCSACSSCYEKLLLPLLPVSDAGVDTTLLHPTLARREDHLLVAAPHVQAVGHLAGGGG